MPTFSAHKIEDALSKRIRSRFNNLRLTSTNLIHGVYLHTNESLVETTFATLNGFKPPLEACHIGFSGLHNFDIIAQRRSSRAIICDINPQNALFIATVLNILRQSNNRKEFLTKIKTYIAQQQRESKFNSLANPHFIESFSSSIFFTEDVSDEPFYQNIQEDGESIEMAHMDAECRKEDGWLYTEERFLHLKKLAETGKIALITEDILNTQRFEDIHRLLQDNGVQIDTVYVSNISDGMTHADRASQENYLATLTALTKNQDTLLIDAPGCFQRLTQSLAMKQKDLYSWFGQEAQDHIKKSCLLMRRQHAPANLNAMKTMYLDIERHILQIQTDSKGCFGFFTSYRNAERRQKIAILQAALTHFKRDKTSFDVIGFQNTLATLVHP